MAKVMHQEDLKQLVVRQFGIRISCELSIVPLQCTEWLAATRWPRFTLLGQTAAAAVVGYRAARCFVPEVRAAAPVFWRRLFFQTLHETRASFLNGT